MALERVSVLGCPFEIILRRLKMIKLNLKPENEEQELIVKYLEENV